jgi:hypothetical protein
MGCALALAAVSSLLAGTAFDAELGVTTETRVTRVDPTGLTASSRASVFAVPAATALADVSSLRAFATYVPRLWTSDAVERSTPYVNHVAEARLESRGVETWTAQASVTGVRGLVDPFEDPWHEATTGAAPAQVATTDRLRFEELRTTAIVEKELGPRTTVSAGAGWATSGAIEREQRALLPTQRRLSVDAWLERDATERDLLRLDASLRRAVTEVAGGPTESAFATSLATWRRRLTPGLEAWLGGGASLVLAGEGEAAGEGKVLPQAEAGVAWVRDPSLSLDAAARLTTFVDRFTGEVSPTAEGRAALLWRAREQLTLAVTALGGRRTDGETTLAAADARLQWTLRERLVLEVGVSGRRQRERRTEVPSFDEGTVFALVTYSTGRLFGTVTP